MPETTADATAAILRAKYVLLTTFKRDGSAVPTPVWAVPDGTGLLIWTPRNSGKVKRIRNSGRVTVAPCTMRGKPTGAALDATASLLDTAGTMRAQDAIGRKYGWIGRTWLRSAVKKAGQDAVIGIHVALLTGAESA